MNETINKPVKNRLNTLVKSGPVIKPLLRSQEPEAMEGEEGATATQSAGRQKISPYSHLLIASLFLVVILCLQTDDVIEKEACKAIVLVLLLCQVKHLSQPAKQS
jgi:hypothetical protein